MPKNRNQLVASANAAAAANNIALSQSLGAAGNLTLNGSLAAAGVATLSPPQNVVIASAGDDHLLTWTITGTDYGGSPITEVLAGGNATPVTSAYTYASVTSIRGSAATASTVTVGEGGAVYSPWLIIGAQRNEFAYQVRTFLAPGGAATYDIQVTSDINLMNQTGGYADDIVTVLAAQTGNTSSFPNAPWMGIRLKVTAGGPVTLRVLENRTA